MQYVIGFLALAFFVWLLIPSRPRDGSQRGGEDASVGAMTGVTGGDIEDAATAAFALRRAADGRETTPAERAAAVAMRAAMEGRDLTLGGE